MTYKSELEEFFMEQICAALINKKRKQQED